MLGGGGIERGRAGGVGSVPIVLDPWLGVGSRFGSLDFVGAGGTTESDPKIAGGSLLATTLAAGGGTDAGRTVGFVSGVVCAAGSAANKRTGSSLFGGSAVGVGAIALATRCADGVAGAVTSALFVVAASELGAVRAAVVEAASVAAVGAVAVAVVVAADLVVVEAAAVAGTLAAGVNGAPNSGLAAAVAGAVALAVAVAVACAA